MLILLQARTRGQGTSFNEHCDTLKAATHPLVAHLSTCSSTTPPYALIWAPIPLITWLFPPIGHLGISDSRGVIHDFAGPYFINKGSSTGLGAPTRYVRLDPSKCEGKAWDDALAHADTMYEGKMHNIVCQNCHHVRCPVCGHATCTCAPRLLACRECVLAPLPSHNICDRNPGSRARAPLGLHAASQHVGDALAEMNYGGKSSFGIVGLGARVFLEGSFTRGGMVATFLPSAVLLIAAFFVLRPFFALLA